MTLHRSKTFAMVGLVALASCAPSVAPAPPATGTPSAPSTGSGVRNVILMVTDGVGIAYWSAAKVAKEDLAVKRMPVVGLVDTRSSDSRVTDSAAGASAYATGMRTYNGAISVRPECQTMLRRDSLSLKRDPSQCEGLESAFDLARRQRMATGVVTTTYIVDATPAAFVAHSPSRYWRDYIAMQFASAGLDVMLGGGRQYFEAATRQDHKDLLGSMCARAVCVSDGAALSAYRADDRPLVGLFAPNNMPPAGKRSPTLPEMVRAALSKLSRDPDGFFAVFETEGTDDAGHTREPLERITAEMLEFDRALEDVLDFARRTPGTLVIVASDHETQGLDLGLRGDTLVAVYGDVGGIGHTGEMVPLFAFGPESERFGGIRENEEIGRMLREVVAERR